MDQISRQLNSEIQALQEYIERTADRYLATVWVSQLLPAFDRLQDRLEEDELCQVLTAFHHAQHHFAVNGLLSPQIQAILGRYEDHVDHLQAAAFAAGDEEEPNDVVLFPESDPEVAPALATHLLFEEEDDELPDPIEGADPEPATAPSSTEERAAAGLFDPVVFAENGQSADAQRSTQAEGSAADEEAAATVAEAGEPAAEPDESGDAALDALFSARLSASPPARGAAALPAGAPPAAAGAGELFAAGKPFPDVPASAPDEAGSATPPDAPPSVGLAPNAETGNVDLLFNRPRSAPKPSAGPPRRAAPDRSATAGTRPTAGSPKKAGRQPAARPAPAKRKEPELQVDIFAAKISLEELQAGLGISLPKQDVANLQVRLRDKIVSDEIPALSALQANEGQYLLMPRLARFIYKQQLYPCTVKNLAKVFSGIFGDLRDLVRYREFPFTSSEYPELGWSLITAEATREGLDKNYMEQNQVLRYLATAAGVPSHRVRRRTLVEAVYDLVVGRLVLGRRLQQQTIDWTGSGPSKSDFVCLYYPPEGIRIRDLPRTAHHRSLGVCPNW